MIFLNHLMSFRGLNLDFIWIWLYIYLFYELDFQVQVPLFGGFFSQAKLNKSHVINLLI